MRAARLAALGAAVVVAAVAAGCDDGAADPPAMTVTGAGPAADCQPGEPVLLVDQIDAAVAAVEAERGGPQEYFEINATPAVVNLFVAADGATAAVPYAFARGQLTAEEPSPAQGNAFTADALDLDPARVTACVSAELPSSTPEVFVVEGGPGGAVRYVVVTSSVAGGQLLTEVTGDGTIVGVQPAG